MRFTSILSTIVFLASVQAARAGLANSEWASTYQTSGGSSVSAKVHLDGDSGWYRTSGGGRGKLSGISYGPPGDDDPAGVTVVKGKWKYENGKWGYFKWYVNGSETRFNGHWRYSDADDDDPAYSWDGDRD